MNFKGFLLGGVFALAPCVPALAQSANPIISGAQACSMSAAALPGGALSTGVVLTADSANSGKIYVGGPGVMTSGAMQGYPLAAGVSISYGNTSLSMIYVICANATDVLHYTGN